MSGFSFNLKKKTGGVSKNGGIKLGLAAAKKKQVKAPILHVMRDSDESDEEGKITAIDGFDGTQGGGISGDVAVNINKDKPLVITPVHLRKGLANLHSEEDLQKKIDEENSKKLQYGITEFKLTLSPSQEETGKVESAQLQTEDELIRSSLLSGNTNNSNNLVIPIEDRFSQSLADDPDEDSESEYERVPVEQFGAAMVRGMGGKLPSNNRSSSVLKTSSILEHRQKGQVLGIGSKVLEADLIEDIMGKRGAKLEIPLVKRDKETGQLVRD